MPSSYLEADVEKRLGQLLKALFGEDGFLYFKFRPFGIVGIPDRILLLRGGRIIFIELKKPKGRVFAWQKRMHANLRRLGFMVEVIWSLEQVAGFVDHLFYD